MSDSKYPPVDNRIRTVRTLINKDWRLARAPVMSLVILGTLCYVVPTTALFFSASSADSWFQMFGQGAVAGLYMTAITAAAFGGIAIAGERANQTADFIAMLPVTRGQIIAGKWTVAFWALAGSVAAHTGIGIASEILGARAGFGAVNLTEKNSKLAFSGSGQFWPCLASRGFLEL